MRTRKPSKHWEKSSRWRKAMESAKSIKHKARLWLLTTHRAFSWSPAELLVTMDAIRIGERIAKQIATTSPFLDILMSGRFDSGMGEPVRVIVSERSLS